MWVFRMTQIPDSAKRKIEAFNRFMKRVSMSDTCWIWTGETSANGYGRFWDGEKKLPAHRWSHGYFIAEVPKGKDACHKCDVRNCVNPAHIFIGSRSENMLDASRKDRLNTNTLGGSSNRLAKMSLKDIYKLKYDDSIKDLTQEELGKLFGVSDVTIRRVLRGVAYRYESGYSDCLNNLVPILKAAWNDLNILNKFNVVECLDTKDLLMRIEAALAEYT